MSKKKYIDADQLLERLSDMRGDLSEEPQYDEGFKDCLDEIEATIKYNFPLVDVVLHDIDSCCRDKISETNGKTKTSELMIIVNGPADNPYYSIRYYDLSDNEWHVGFSSYCLQYVISWKNEYFEVVGDGKDSDEDATLKALLSALSEVSKYIGKDKLISALRETGESKQRETAAVDDTNKYIDKDVLVSDLKAANESDRMVYMGVFDIINEQPIADVKEVRYGRWERRLVEKNGITEMKSVCSECGKPNKRYTPPYCPHCGARMDSVTMVLSEKELNSGK